MLTFPHLIDVSIITIFIFHHLRRLRIKSPTPECQSFKTIEEHGGTPATISRALPRVPLTAPQQDTTPFLTASNVSPTGLSPSPHLSSSPLPPSSFHRVFTSAFSCDMSCDALRPDLSNDPRQSGGLCLPSSTPAKECRVRRVLKPLKPGNLEDDPTDPDIWPILYPSIQCR